MSRTTIAGAAATLAAVVAALLLWLWPVRVKSGMSFLVIVVDSMRADHLGVYGYPRETSPRIDRLGREGVVFDNAIAQAPWTKPSVASLFTSTYISVHRVLYSEQEVSGRKVSDVLDEKFLTLAEAMKAGGFATGGFGQKIHLRPEFGFSQGFDAYGMRAGRAARINRAALGWLEDADPDRFFLYLHYNDPHYPYRPREGYDRFRTAPPRVQITGDTKRAFREGRLELTSEDMHELVDLYDGEILYADHQIGSLVDDIAELGYGNLLVLITADHGEEFLDHGDITHGHTLYGELVRVPMIVSGSALPDSARRRRVAAGAQIIDIMPTILQLAGLPEPPGLQGRSLATALRDEPTPSGAPGTIDVFSQRRDVQETEFESAISDGRWKLVLDPTRARSMLFDLTADPGETLRLEASNPDIAVALQQRLGSWAGRNASLHDRIRPGETTPLDPETEERLRSLGYIN